MEGLKFYSDLQKEIFSEVMQREDVNLSLMQLKEFDCYTYEHCVRVCALAIQIGIDLLLDKEDLRILGIAGALHDIGKMRVEPSIVKKPSKLTELEYNLIKMHSIYSVEWVAFQGYDKKVLRAVAEHHERIDGSGYPLGVSQISLLGKILAAADIFDAVNVKRVYNNKALTDAESIEVVCTTTGLERDVVSQLQLIKQKG